MAVQRYRKQPGQTKHPRRRQDARGVVWDVVTSVLRAADREHPADAVLRAELSQCAGLVQAQKSQISRMVFTYYRWKGWLDNERGVESKLQRALELDERFRKNPFSLPVEQLRSKVVPAWVASEMEVRDEWLRVIQRELKLWLRAKTGQGRLLAKKLLGRPGSAPLQDAVLFDGSRDLFQTDEFKSGEFEIQDISSQMVGWACSPKAGETWWDACAGEGGKTLHLSDLMENKGLIWASDRAEWRLEKLKQRAARAGVFNYRAAIWEGGADLPTGTKFDGVLVDAPCSGLGTWQRNPHARWTTTPEDVRELAQVQGRLLDNASSLVKPGGKLIYAVCTLTRAETAGVVEAFNRAHSEFEPMAFSLPMEKGNSRLVPAVTKMIWPQDFGGNGMFISAWRRRC